MVILGLRNIWLVRGPLVVFCLLLDYSSQSEVRGVDSAFSAICRQGLLWLRDFYCSLMRLPFFLLYSILWAARRSCDYHKDLKGWSGWVARRPLSVVFSLDSQQPGAAHTSQLPQKLGVLCWY